MKSFESDSKTFAIRRFRRFHRFSDGATDCRTMRIDIDAVQ